MTTHQVTMKDGAILHVKVLGDVNSTKPLLIALHGAPGASNHTEPEQGYGFLANKLRVLVFDARGSGKSSLQPPYTHPQWISDVEELRIWAKATKILLAGGSYGGFLSLDYALVHPTHLYGLILRDTWAWGFRGTMNALKLSLTSPRTKGADIERQTRLWTGILKDDDDFAASIAEMSALWAKDDTVTNKVEWVRPAEEEEEEKEVLHAATQNAAFSQNMPVFDVRARLGEIEVPTLVVVGRHDLITPVEYSEEIHRGIVGSRLVVFENSGHNPTADEPEAFQKAVFEFLSRGVLE